MYAPTKLRRIKLSMVGTALLLVAAVVTPTFAADQTASNTDRSTNQPDNYALQGDYINPIGTGLSVFQSTGGSLTIGTWDFKSSSTTSGAIALYGHCTGSSTSCTGVKGTSSGDGGVNAPGVLGDGGSGSVGVKGISSGTFSGSTSVYGLNSATADYAYGVLGSVTASSGTNSKGVYGTANQGIGVYGSSSSGNGVYGSSSSGNGVYGTSSTGVALFGSNTGTGSGFYGFSAGGPGGVMGSNGTEGARFYTRNSSSYALVTGSLPNTYGNAYITGHIYATGGCCSTVETDAGNKEMYANESTRDLFSDQGTAALVNGKAVVTIDPLFAQTVNLTSDYQVFLTPEFFDTAGLGVGNMTATGFEVRELNGGKGNFKFSWRIDALRKGYETKRMSPAPAAPTTSGAAYDLPANLPTAVNSLDEESAIQANLQKGK